MPVINLDLIKSTINGEKSPKIMVEKIPYCEKTLSTFVRTHCSDEQQLFIEIVETNNLKWVERALKEESDYASFTFEKDGIEQEPISIAIERGYIEMAELLIKYGALDFEGNYTPDCLPLLDVVYTDNIEMAKMLLKHANIHICHSTGMTALHVAVRQQKPDFVKLYLENGACPHQRDMDGVSAYEMGKEGDNKEIYKLLIEAVK